MYTGSVQAFSQVKINLGELKRGRTSLEGMRKLTACWVLRSCSDDSKR